MVASFNMSKSQKWLLLAAFAAVLFCAIAFALTSDAITFLDEKIRLEVHNLASPFLTSIALNVTRLGSLWFLMPFGAVTVVILVRQSHRAQALFLAMTLFGSIILENALKVFFGRLRPQVYFGLVPDSYAFPSGHALFSLCFYSMIAIEAARYAASGTAKIVIWCAAAALVSAVGLTRIYLGVHYPSDVLGGYLAALAWVALSWFMHERFLKPMI